MAAEPWMRLSVAAAYAACHEKTMLKALRRGELRGVQARVGAVWRTRASYVDAWLAGDGVARKKLRVTRRSA